MNDLKTVFKYEAPSNGAFLVEMNSKNIINDLFSVLIPVLVGIASMIIWRQNISFNIRDNLWLSRDVKVVYLLVSLSTVSFLSAFVIWKKISFYSFILCFSIIYTGSWLGYYLSKKLFFLLYDKAANNNHVLYVWMLIVIVGLVSMIFYLIINNLIKKLRPFHIFTFVAVFISVVPASLITVEWFPDESGLKTFINSIKLGYPVLWVNILIGLTTYALTKKFI